MQFDRQDKRYAPEKKEKMKTLENLPPVLDACCGGRMFWFDRADERALFCDKRRESFDLYGPSKPLFEVNPDMLVDFSDMPFPDNSFQVVSFDPPHIQRDAARGFLTKKYGVLSGDWREMIRKGFSECFRVLRPGGTLIFKWSESEVPVSKILELTPEKPLFGNRCGKKATTHWIVFIKTGAKDERQAVEQHITSRSTKLPEKNIIEPATSCAPDGK